MNAESSNSRIRIDVPLIDPRTQRFVSSMFSNLYSKVDRFDNMLNARTAGVALVVRSRFISYKLYSDRHEDPISKFTSVIIQKIAIRLEKNAWQLDRDMDRHLRSRSEKFIWRHFGRIT